MNPITDKVRQAVNRMVSPGDRVLAAVSGGPDSVVMLHQLKELMQGPPSFELAIAHLNHLARGEDSREDAVFVARLGKQLGLETFVEEIDVAAEKELMKTSFQETARVVRYEFLERILKQWGGTRIALGHTADDQAETILMNLLRGSGSLGLTGMRPQRDRLMRPLHECFRHEVEAYIEQFQLEFRSDPSNLQTDYLRNRIRLELIPFLERYNPQIKSTLLETSRILSDDEECLQALVDGLYAEAATDAGEKGLSALDVDTVKAQHPALQKRLVRQAIREAKGDLRRIAARHIQMVLGLLDAPGGGKEIHLPGGLAAVYTGKALIFYKNPPRRSGILKEGRRSVPLESLK
ncbi:MAG: tRNA lysidine(34) synthetase TilS [Nitrospinae bacterium]|nr:tRNA lysidine(34) synthetase TilS [Nitrospinota bacterium]